MYGYDKKEFSSFTHGYGANLCLYSFIAAALLAAPYILDILFNFKELIKAKLLGTNNNRNRIS